MSGSRAWGEHQMDGNAQRAQLVGQAAMLACAWLVSSWAVVAALAAAMAGSAVCWPQAALFVQVHQRLVVPHKRAVPPIDARPPRVSAAVGAAILTVVAGLLASGMDSIGWALVLLNVGAMIAEAVFGRCAPCELFVWLSRRGLVRLVDPLVGR